MPQIVQQGQINLAALNVPDLIVQIVPPQLLINGVPSNIIGLVGTATWGPKNVPTVCGSYSSYVLQFGYPQPRLYDIGSALWAATLQGAQSFKVVRVTDGTDTAASAVVQTNCMTLTSLYTGSLGNTIGFNVANGPVTGSYNGIVTMGSNVPEVFVGISGAVAALSVTAGTYTVCPTLLTISAPDMTSAATVLRQAVVVPTLAVTGSPTIGGTMTGYLANDIVTFQNGVTIKVSTVTGGAISTFTLTNPGVVYAGGTAPATPLTQVSTSGTGTGATLSAVTWGLAASIQDGGSGYKATPTVTVVGGTGTGGTVTASVAIWPNMAAAINNGVSGLRGPSQRVSAAAGVGTSTPTITAYTLSGGTDGANPSSIGQQGVPAMMGQDVVPRTGMYAMRSALISIGVLVDVTDSTTWTTQTTFGLSEGIYMIGVTQNGDNVNTAPGVLATAGVNSYAFKLMFGDWVYINDPVTGAQRMISPQGFIAGVMGNQSPEQSPLNKPMFGIVGTQKSKTGIQYTTADLSALSSGGLDVITNPCPGGNYFGCRLGINTSSNLAVNGDNYTRMTFFIARTIAQGCGTYVGQLQTKQERYEAQTTLAAFFANLEFLGMIGNVNGGPAYDVQIDAQNNPFSLVSLGYQFAYVQVTYLSVIRYFIIDLEGGQTVLIADQLPTSTGTVKAGDLAPAVG